MKGSPSRGWLLLLGAGLALGAVVVFLALSFPEALADQDQWLRLVYLVALLAVLASGAAWRRRPPLAQWLRQSLIWLAIGVVLVSVYALRHDALTLYQRVVAELLPHQGSVVGSAVSFAARQGGQFVIEAEVDGTRLRFLVDTGASDVVLSPADAERLGIDLAKLSFDRRYATANGPVLGAPVRLRRVAVGPIVLEDVRASVNQAAMQHSLLGMSFLGRLGRYEVREGVLTLER